MDSQELLNKIRDEAVAEAAASAASYKDFDLSLLVSAATTPIEQLMAVSLAITSLHSNLFLDAPSGLWSLASDFRSIHDAVYIRPQRKVGVYALDFRLEHRFREKSVLLAVECDGHDFHEKTKAQAAKDKARDRAMVRAGIQTIRFTGSEIFKDPMGCAREAWATLGRLAMERFA